MWGQKIKLTKISQQLLSGNLKPLARLSFGASGKLWGAGAALGEPARMPGPGGGPWATAAWPGPALPQATPAPLAANSLSSCPPPAVGGGGEKTQAAHALCGPHPLGTKTSSSL